MIRGKGRRKKKSVREKEREREGDGERGSTFIKLVKISNCKFFLVMDLIIRELDNL